jgi:lipase ATG15
MPHWPLNHLWSVVARPILRVRSLRLTGALYFVDTVEKLGWSVDVRTHRINFVIDNLLKEDWDGSKSESVKPELAKATQKVHQFSWHFPRWRRRPGNDGDNNDDGDDGDGNGSVPPAKPVVDCVDCFRWEFGDGEGFK